MVSDPQLATLQLAGKSLKAELATLEETYTQTMADLNAAALRIPNRIHPDVPDGAPRLVRSAGAPKPEFPFAPRDHLALNEVGGADAAPVCFAGDSMLTLTHAPF